jgi:hypothetical protein
MPRLRIEKRAGGEGVPGVGGHCRELGGVPSTASLDPLSPISSGIRRQATSVIRAPENGGRIELPHLSNLVIIRASAPGGRGFPSGFQSDPDDRIFNRLKPLSRKFEFGDDRVYSVEGMGSATSSWRTSTIQMMLCAASSGRQHRCQSGA